MVKLHRNKKIILFLLTLFYSCTSNSKQEEHQIKEMDHEIKINMIPFIKKHVGEDKYNLFYRKANDTLESWVDHKLEVSKMQRFSSWKLDSLICFNSNKDKCIMGILNKESPTVNNSINYLYGVKIKTDWYFFYGPTFYPSPGNHNPLSFEKLHEIAVESVFRDYLKKSQDGGWEVNDSFFKQLDYSNWGFFDSYGKLIDNSKLTREQIDSCLLEKAVYSKWRQKDIVK